MLIQTRAPVVNTCATVCINIYASQWSAAHYCTTVLRQTKRSSVSVFTVTWKDEAIDVTDADQNVVPSWNGGEKKGHRADRQQENWTSFGQWEAEHHQGLIYHPTSSPELLIPSGCVSTDTDRGSAIVWSKEIRKGAAGAEGCWSPSDSPTKKWTDRICTGYHLIGS